MKRLYLFTLFLLFSLISTVQAQSSTEAQAELKDANGQPVGSATFVEGSGGVEVTLQVTGLPPGDHGFHIHTSGELIYTNDRITLGAGPNSLFDADSSAVVIHAGPDDNSSDPAGNSGARIACGVIMASQPTTLPTTGGPSIWLLWLVVGLGFLLLGGGLMARMRAAC